MNDRLIEIQVKLKRLKEADRKYTIFSSGSHRYISTNVPAADLSQFETANGITLPANFRDFLLTIGTGAGPDCGILTLMQMTKEFNEWLVYLDGNSKMMSNCNLTNEDAATLLIEKKRSYNDRQCKKLNNANGILPIQTGGCTYFTYIILNGEQKGKVWAVNIEGFETFPCGTQNEFDFLDWYENWLDESLEKFPLEAKNNSQLPHVPWWKKF